MLEVSNLHVVYGTGRLRVDAVKDVSFRVERGEILGFREGGSGREPARRPQEAAYQRRNSRRDPDRRPLGWSP